LQRLTRAFCEYLIENFNAKTIIATHNHELTKLEEEYPDIAFNYVMGDSDNEIYALKNRKIKRGIAKTSLAINTAMLANLPEEIIKRAKKYAK
jgi:DNA mismatch repair protein MutS